MPSWGSKGFRIPGTSEPLLPRATSRDRPWRMSLPPTESGSRTGSRAPLAKRRAASSRRCRTQSAKSPERECSTRGRPTLRRAPTTPAATGVEGACPRRGGSSNRAEGFAAPPRSREETAWCRALGREAALAKGRTAPSAFRYGIVQEGPPEAGRAKPERGRIRGRQAAQSGSFCAASTPFPSPHRRIRKQTSLATGTRRTSIH